MGWDLLISHTPGEKKKSILHGMHTSSFAPPPVMV